MLTIRLQRTGRKNQPTFRVVLTESRSPTKSGEQEILGHYLPQRNPAVLECNQERVAYWIGKGAIPSDTLARLLSKAGMKGLDKYIVRYAKQKPKKEPPPEAAKPAASAPVAETPVAEEKAPEAAAEAPKAEEKPADETEKKAE